MRIFRKRPRTCTRPRWGLQESMRRFDASRGKTVAKIGEIEHPPLGHDDATQNEKDLLHLWFCDHARP